MLEGNRRFVAGEPLRPRQGSERRHETSGAQYPHAALLGCADSRLAAEIIFDEGLGDLFVVRNAGQVVSPSVVGSLEYAVAALKVPLIVVLAHDSCGAVAAAIEQSSRTPSAVTLPVANTLAPILPAVQRQWLAEHRETPYVDPSAVEANAVGRIHMKTTVNQLLSASQTIRDAVDRGDVAIVGCQYSLVEGRAIPYISVGKLDIEVADAS